MSNPAGNIVATSVILSSIVSCVVASGATYLMSRDASEAASNAGSRCTAAEVNLGEASRRISSLDQQLRGALAAMQAAADGYSDTGSILQGMRAELDEMQTQIRLLKLMAR